jgi:hypothetical protein
MTTSLTGWKEVAAMGGPWRERGFDPASLRSPRPWSKRHVEVAARERQEAGGLNKLVLAYIAAVAMSFGLMVSLLHGGW